jgi:hypothetical protein
MIGIPLCIDHLAFLVSGYKNTAPHRTETAYGGSFLGTLNAELGSKLSSINLCRREVKSEMTQG